MAKQLNALALCIGVAANVYAKFNQGRAGHVGCKEMSGSTYCPMGRTLFGANAPIEVRGGGWCRIPAACAGGGAQHGPAGAKPSGALSGALKQAPSLLPNVLVASPPSLAQRFGLGSGLGNSLKQALN